ncbi:peptidase S45 penicillin amidase [Anaeromyxobacter dehalogenans 2CP-1]|uniref:Peptidase S45 penicillin amidase n=1 Tax=Anaeromyxobacter dehalogenans (strain ATCC BAA-258 / DSM 21875 / 2CP-1) TaxID=455488 RepID=B8J9G7_ANAD2|nr:penicillin acylase family protein [Anaeromyxobacter dehalogenans]ACL67355.1 peptidase S45 penicillin amidase [Anaeromyxobacter dehalogenans 2CP-1]
MRAALVAASLAVLAGLTSCSSSSTPTASAASAARGGTAPGRLPGLHGAATITRDGAGIAHLRAADEHDLFLLQGWVHAQDRLFQMDVTRRRAAGRLAELLGPGALPGDVQLRTFGLARAAARSLPLLSTRAVAALEAYADGVNAWAETHPLPPEYAALELTTFEPWTVQDSLLAAKLIAFGLSFDVDDVERTVALATYQQAGAALGFDGAALFFEDLWRSAPFDSASTVPDALAPSPAAAATARAAAPSTERLHPRAVALAAEFLGRVKGDAFLSRLTDREERDGSNQWVIAGAYTAGGSPMLASDPHLALGAPSTFYPVHLQAGPFDVIGNSFAGVPSVVVGHNRHLAWGATVDPFDVTDVFQEQVVPDPTSPSGLATVYQGALEPVIPYPEAYLANVIGDAAMNDLVPVPPGNGIPAATLVVPRRNQGPIIQLDPTTGVALSVQYTGFSGTRELDAFLGYDLATGIDDFVTAMRHFDVGSQNFCYADDAGNIAYFTHSAVPVREDLQQGTVDGLPPFFIRDGTGGNEWLPVQHPQPLQVLPYEVVPLEELPHVVNPPAGFAVNANNDPAGLTLENAPLTKLRPGGGIYYLAPGFDAGFRAGRITRRVKDVLAAGKMTFEQMQSIQADVTLLDAEVLVPYLTAALEHARREGAPAPLAALGADAAVADAVARLAAWDGSTPTGIPEGWDSDDPPGKLSPPPQAEVDASVAATIYSTWRGQAIRNVIDSKLGTMPLPPSQQAMTALRNLLDRFDAQQGVGASGIDFFAVPGLEASPADRRDLVLLKSLADALALLSGPDFAAAFGGSTNPEDWRWGKLHRIVFAHPMGGPFSVPTAFGAFPAPLPGLPGIPTDGGFGVVDASSHGARAASANAFMFSSGPSNRLVVELSRGAVKRAESAWPGGASGVPGEWNDLNLLPLWLSNDTVPLFTRASDLGKDTHDVVQLVP